MYADILRHRFPDLDPVADDLFLLEPHQIASLPDRAPAAALAAVVHADPRLYRFLTVRCPTIAGYLEHTLRAHHPVVGEQLEALTQELMWEIADWIVYQRAPQRYDATDGGGPDLATVEELADLSAKTVVDAGAGTGALAATLAPVSRVVFAVEPVAALRRYMRHRVAQEGIPNLFVLDGFLHAMPLPADSVDVLVTRRAIGWRLEDELAEIERVVRPSGCVVHLLGTLVAEHEPLHEAAIAHGYQSGLYRDDGGECTKFCRKT